MYISSMAVDENHRRRGIGKLLLQKLLQLSDALSTDMTLLHVEQDNLPAIKMYQAVNFEVGHPNPPTSLQLSAPLKKQPHHPTFPLPIPDGDNAFPMTALCDNLVEEHSSSLVSPQRYQFTTPISQCHGNLCPFVSKHALQGTCRSGGPCMGKHRNKLLRDAAFEGKAPRRLDGSRRAQQAI